MRAVNTFCTVTLILAAIMTAIHYAVIALRHRMRASRHGVPVFEHQSWNVIEGGQIMSLDAPTDYRNAVLPDQEKAQHEWISLARQTAERLARQNGQITSDDIWDVCPPPVGADPRVMGAVFADKTIWQRVGYVKSARKINHGRPVTAWTLRAVA
jgi:hypothetical protein